MSRHPNNQQFFLAEVVPSRLPSFVELVEKFLIIFQDAVSGLADSEKEEMAVCIIPEVCV